MKFLSKTTFQSRQNSCQTAVSKSSIGLLIEAYIIAPFLYSLLNETGQVTMRLNSTLNKSAAGMQHTPPRDIFNAKKIILKLELFFYEKTDVSPLLISKAWVIKYNFKQKH